MAVTIMYTFGWRLKEVMGLRLAQVDLEAGTLRLEPGTTKNRDGRVAYLTPELKILLREQIDRVLALSRARGQLFPWLFTHLSGCNAGTPGRDFRVAWTKAIERAGLSGKLQHDFPRTVVRNMERAGGPRSVAMKITGHKTESVYRRYAIVCDAGLQEAPRKLTGTIRAQSPTSSLDASAQLCEKTGGLA